MNDKLIALLVNCEAVHFGDPSQGPFTTEEALQNAEARLGVSLPPSYRWWCRTFGGGEIGPYEVFSVYPHPQTGTPSGDIVWVNEHTSRESFRLLIHRASEGDEEFWLDLSRRDSAGESPVILWELGSEEEYAPTFAEFLRKRATYYGAA